MVARGSRGSTWYELRLAPEPYWQLFSDYLIHRIHNRVLQHIKAETEARAGAADFIVTPRGLGGWGTSLLEGSHERVK
jgi:hypothetical protein